AWDLACVGVDATWNVERNDLQVLLRRVELSCQRCERLAQSALRADSSQRVHRDGAADQRAAQAARVVRQADGRATRAKRPQLIRSNRVARRQDEVNGRRVFEEPSSGYRAVAPVVSVADEHDYPLIRLDKPKDLLGDGPAGPLLQFRFRNAAGKRGRFEAAHLFDGNDLQRRDLLLPRRAASRRASPYAGAGAGTGGCC